MPSSANTVSIGFVSSPRRLSTIAASSQSQRASYAAIIGAKSIKKWTVELPNALASRAGKSSKTVCLFWSACIFVNNVDPAFKYVFIIGENLEGVKARKWKQHILKIENKFENVAWAPELGNPPRNGQWAPRRG
jgi:hypothetical protein